MKTFKILLALLFLVISSCDNKTEKNDGVFKKLGYDPKWEEIPSIEEFKEVFFKTTGQRFDDKVNDCAYELIHSNYSLRKISKAKGRNFDNIVDKYTYKYNHQDRISYLRNICFNSLMLDLNYLKKGNKLNCKRSEFFRNLIENGSSWLLRNNYSKEVINNWFGNKYFIPENNKIDNLINTIYDPFIIKEAIFKSQKNIISCEKPEYAPLCKAVAEHYGFLFYDKAGLNDKIKKIEKDTNIAQSNVDLADSGEADYIIELDYNNDGKKELIHRTYLYGEPEKGHSKNSANCNDIFDTSCCDSNYDLTVNRAFLTSYENNIEEIKTYLKTPNLTIKDLDHLNSIKEKFGGKDINYECLYDINIPTKDFDFFSFNEQTYIIYFDKGYCEIIFINGSKHHSVGYSQYLYPEYLEDFDNKENLISDYVKASVAGSFPIYYVNEDDYLYDKSLLNEIKRMSYNIANKHNYLREHVEEYLKQQAKTICNIDLDKIRYKPENKAIILKLIENNDDAVLDETKVIKNSDVAEEQKICGLNQENERCTLYILNNSSKEIKARYLYIFASKKIGISQRELMYLNDEYSNTIIKPNHFAEIDISIPYYLYYWDEQNFKNYIK